MEEQDYRTTYELEGHNWWFVGMRRTCTEWVARCLARPTAAAPVRPPRILDVGCGTGINIEAFERFGPTVGLDRSSTALAFCRERGRTDLVQADGVRLPFPDGAFDVVTAIGVVEHIEADRAALAEWARVLAPGGRLVLLTSAYQWMWSGHDTSNHHVRRYTTRQVRSMLAAAGLGEVRSSYVNCFLFPPIAVVRLVERAMRRGRPPAPHKDTGEVPGPANRLLVALLGLEARLLRRTDLPFGVSMVASGIRSGTSSG
ncbi:MAG: class I SAM-dependent methyltransferase [Acidimicrobiales bacterium]